MINLFRAPLLNDLSFITSNRPYLSYNWSTSFNDGNRVLINAGNSNPEYKADLYFGSGCAFNGVDQNVLIPNVKTPVDTIFFTMDSGRLNSLIFNCWIGRSNVTQKIGIEYYDDNITYKVHAVKNSENKKNFCFSFDRVSLVMSFYGNGELIDTLQIVAPYHTDISKEIGTRGGSGYIAGITSNLIYTKGNLQPHEIMYQYTNPEKFLYHEKQLDDTFIAKSEILNQSQIDNVVAHFPMTETDGYARNMIGYSEGVLNTDLTNFGASGVNGNNTKTVDGYKISYHLEDASAKTYQPQIIMFNNNRTDTDTYIFTAKLIVNSGTVKISGTDFIKNDDNYIKGGEYEVGEYTFRWVGNFISNGRYGINFDGKNYHTCDFSIEMSETKITSTYPIANFTTSCRDDAKNLQYGTQCCFFERDELGVIIGSSFNELTFHNIEDRVITKKVSMDNIVAIECVYVNSIDKYNYNRLFSIYKDDGTLVLEVQRLGTNNQLYLKVNSQNTGNYINLLPINHIVYEVNIANNTVSMFQNGVQVGGVVDITDPIVTTPSTLYIGNSNALTRGITGAIRLFKVYTKPQDPAQLYAEAVLRGLVPELTYNINDDMLITADTPID